MDKVHNSRMLSKITIALKPLALAATGMTGADIERLIREARQKARRHGRQLSFKDIETALTFRQRQMPTNLVWRIAVHEAGHALAWTLFDIGIVKIITIGNASGGFVETDVLGDLVKDEAWIMKMLACSLAGQAAEKLIFGKAGTGAGGTEYSDLALATRLAVEAETTMGYGRNLPLLYRSVEHHPTLLSLDRKLAQHVHERLQAAERMAHDLLSRQRDALLALATRLSEAGTLEGDEVRSLLAEKMSTPKTGDG